jgi:hypothetical protein
MNLLPGLGSLRLRVVLGGVAAIFHGVFEIANAFAHTLSELRKLSRSENDDHDGENQQKFGNAEITHMSLLARSSYPDAGLVSVQEREQLREGASRIGVTAQHPKRGVPMRPIDLTARQEHLLEGPQDLPGPLE